MKLAAILAFAAISTCESKAPPAAPVLDLLGDKELQDAQLVSETQSLLCDGTMGPKAESGREAECAVSVKRGGVNRLVCMRVLRIKKGRVLSEEELRPLADCVRKAVHTDAGIRIDGLLVLVPPSTSRK